MVARRTREPKKTYNPAEIICIHLSIPPFLLQLVTLLTLIAVILLVISLEHIIDVEDGVDSILTSSPSITNSTISSSKSISSGTGAIQSSGSEQDYDNDNNQLHLSESEGKILTFSLISIAVIVGLVLVANAQTFFRVIKSLMFSQRRHLQSAIAKLDVVKSEGYLQAVKGKSLLREHLYIT